jgi:hypothetical protein
MDSQVTTCVPFRQDRPFERWWQAAWYARTQKKERATSTLGAASGVKVLAYGSDGNRHVQRHPKFGLQMTLVKFRSVTVVATAAIRDVNTLHSAQENKPPVVATNAFLGCCMFLFMRLGVTIPVVGQRLSGSLNSEKEYGTVAAAGGGCSTQPVVLSGEVVVLLVAVPATMALFVEKVQKTEDRCTTNRLPGVCIFWY